MSEAYKNVGNPAPLHVPGCRVKRLRYTSAGELVAGQRDMQYGDMLEYTATLLGLPIRVARITASTKALGHAGATIAVIAQIYRPDGEEVGTPYEITDYSECYAGAVARMYEIVREAADYAITKLQELGVHG